MNPDITFPLLILLLLLALSAFFSGAEVALLAVSKARVERYVAEHRHGARALQRLKARPRRMIVTILIGNNVVNVSASAITTVVVENTVGSEAIGYAAGILTFLLLVFGEISPKTIAQANSGSFALVVAPIVQFLEVLLFPFVWLLEHIARLLHRLAHNAPHDALNEAELRTMIRFGVEEDVIEPEEQYIINRAMRFSDTRVERVMTRKREMFLLDAKTPADAALAKMLEIGYSRVPIYSGNRQHVTGIALLKELIRTDLAGKVANVGHLAKEPIFVHPGTPIDDVFKIFQKKQSHMAIVHDPDDGILGLVTLEDLVEELVGEIEDESDPEGTGHSDLERAAAA
jgi:CBS domain containing-hemolysin-like protein